MTSTLSVLRDYLPTITFTFGTLLTRVLERSVRDPSRSFLYAILWSTVYLPSDELAISHRTSEAVS